ncbi:sporulation inhibitor KapD [Planctomycetes bacterium Pan216]|uniref:Sporulation inhibitor KapD n=1 Tax=Kolteria novifilia TaxID=2527975 RepID=A0A518B2A8_9BACT|nr:sporulation inhibitor KapD [Planctomycetes bacterium Pan216]
MSEIIEIGVCPVDAESLTRMEKRSILIKPVRSRICGFRTTLTTLTTELLTDAGTFAQACKTLKSEYHARSRLWASWGDYDRRQFEGVGKELGVGYPFGTSHLNVKSLFATALGSTREMGVAGAFERLGLTMEGTHHRGDDDAWNIAEILCRLLRLMREGLM